MKSFKFNYWTLCIAQTVGLVLTFHTYAADLSYEIEIDHTTVNFTGRDVSALAVNGTIPGPTIEGFVGDQLKVTVRNKLDVATSIHWHGVLLPNDQDGVPYLTTPPIEPHTSLTFEFPITHSGTYWYHSHTGFQEQRGVYGALVFHPEQESQNFDHEIVLVFSDWTDENPQQVLANLKRDGDYYALKKDTVQSWWKVFASGRQAVSNRIKSAWTRMGPMDISDVGYDAFLANGKPVISLADVKKGQKVKLRLINAAASSYFDLDFAGGPFTVVAADGIDVAPVMVSRLKMAIAETYDVVLSIDEDKAFELRASAEDKSGWASVFLGGGERKRVSSMGSREPMGMDHSAHHGHMKNQEMTEYQLLRALAPTELEGGRDWREVKLRLTGFMDGYVWSFDNKTLSESDAIPIRKGENVRFVLTNDTMMHHPIHLHGHFFRVLNGAGAYSPLKHTVNVPAMESVTIEFQADEEKDWFFHCHNLYHMMAGMARVVSYEESSRYDHGIRAKLDHDSSWYRFTEISVQSNMAAGSLRLANSRNQVELEFDWNYDEQHEIEALYERRISRFLSIYAGGKLEADPETENTGVIGVHYMLPLLIMADMRVDTDGQLRLGLHSSLQLTDRLKFDWDWNTDREYRLGLEYELDKRFVLATNYDSDYFFGAGVKVRF